MAKPLTAKQLVSLNPDRVYNIKNYVLNINLWKILNATTRKQLNKIIPKKYPFDANIQKSLSKTAKGIYLFTVEPDFKITPEIIHLLYVGKVEGTNTWNRWVW